MNSSSKSDINITITNLITHKQSRIAADKANVESKQDLAATNAALFEMLMDNLDEWDPNFIKQVVEAILLGLAVRPELCTSLTKALNGSYLERYQAIEALGTLVTTDAKPVLELLHDNTNHFIRALAASRLKYSQGDYEIITNLIKALKDKDPDVICEVAKSLSILKEMSTHFLDEDKKSKYTHKNSYVWSQAEIVLYELLHHKNLSVCCQTSNALVVLQKTSTNSQVGYSESQSSKKLFYGKPSIPKLLLNKLLLQRENSYPNESKDIVHESLYQIEEIVDTFVKLQNIYPDTVDDLVATLRQNSTLSVTQRYIIINALGAMHSIDYSIVTALLRQLNYPNEYIRYAAINALSNIKSKDPRIIPALLNLLDDHEVACHALKALGMLQYVDPKMKKNALVATNVRFKEKIENLVFSGGGAAGYAYAGAVEALNDEPSFSFDELKAVAGTSIGAIAALSVSLKYTPEEASNLLNTLDLKAFADGGNFIQQKKRVLSDKGRFKGEQLEEFIKTIISRKIITEHPENITFADLKNLGFRNLCVVANKVCNINGEPTMKEIKFSAATTPNTSVLTAVHASAAAPWYFACVRMKQVGNDYMADSNGLPFVDGGLLNNYPIEVFDKNENGQIIPNPHTLGLILLRDSQMTPAPEGIVSDRFNNGKQSSKTLLSNANQYLKALLGSVLFESVRQKLANPANLDRTIQIDRLEVGLADFDIDNKTKMELKQSAKSAVKYYFSCLHEKTEEQQTEEISKQTQDALDASKIEQSTIEALNKTIEDLKRTIAEQQKKLDTQSVAEQPCYSSDLCKSQSISESDISKTPVELIASQSNLITQSFFPKKPDFSEPSESFQSTYEPNQLAEKTS